MEAVEGFEAQSTYAKPLSAHAMPSFLIPESNLGMGASLGNSELWIHTKGTGAIERTFLNDIGLALTGAVSVRYGAHARPFGLDLPGHVLDDDSAYSGMFPENGSRIFEIHPAHQTVRFTLGSVLEIEETTFLPLGDVAPGHQDTPVVNIGVRLHNADGILHHIRMVGSAMLKGATAPDVRAHFDPSVRGLVAVNESKPDWVRIFALSEPPTRYGSDFDVAATYDPTHLHWLPNDTDARGDLIGRLQLDLTLAAGETKQLWFSVALYACGADEAVRRFNGYGTPESALQQSVAHLQEVLCNGEVLTPDPVINHGALWSKVNVRRVMATYPSGCAFTNDPGTYANIVVRDCAWYIFGNDHFLPQFSRKILENIAARQYPSGKLPEYFDAVTGRIEDDGLNINDDTPLYIMAVNHHFRATGDPAWLRSVYPSIARAARYIISQIDERGLVYCSANDPRGNVWAISGWRNIIPEYSINGAVTEINAECVAALRAASHLADNLGELESDRDEFAGASARVRAAMDKLLVNPENGLYYLNIDVDGNPRTDVTGDEIFPVMMRACSEDTGFRIISRLNCPDFWTTAGLRTVSRLDPRYDPAASSGLLGGVWPGLTWWFAFGAARYHPDMMVRALRSSFEHYGSAPKRNNTVPGQFSEWFDGESLENRGMRLSPWEPPRFLWAAIEGVCGLMLSPGAPRINPLIPPTWSWVGLRKLPYHGSFLSYFLVREGASGFRVYSTAAVDSAWDVAVYNEDVSDRIRVYADDALAIALTRTDGAAILIGNTGEQTVHTPLMIQDALPPSANYYARTYNSERGGWEDGGVLASSDLHGAALSIEAGGFRLVELTLLP